MDPNTNDLLPINTPGEICSRGFNTMLGYWNDPDKTKETITKDRWLKTGYLAILIPHSILQDFVYGLTREFVFVETLERWTKMVI